MRIRQRHGFIGSLFSLLVLCIASVYGVAAITAPWSFHIGGRWTPLLSWSATGELVTKAGTYPLHVVFYPSPHSSRLPLDGLRPTGGVRGSGSLCASQGAIQHLELMGTIYNGWRSTEGSLIEFRLIEPKILGLGEKRGFFDLYGHWHGPELVMDDRGQPGSTFRSGLKIEHASVNLNWRAYSDSSSDCASATNAPVHR